MCPSLLPLIAIETVRQIQSAEPFNNFILLLDLNRRFETRWTSGIHDHDNDHDYDNYYHNTEDLADQRYMLQRV